ncbi:MAG: two-component sensor histidine kinase, partial [Clostridiales bacterium]|nr:two-component sensor histidine kinase [Clostridiales bacterium]
VPDVYIEFLNDINKEIDRLNNIITDLLSLVKMDAQTELSEFTTLDLSDLIKRTIKRLGILADKKDISLDVDIAGGIMVKGDGPRLQLAISNLVDNAIRYTPEGGQVMIDAYVMDDQAIVKVSDTGIGIPAEEIPHIFDRFFRVDKARSRYTGGTGLGLSIAQNIVLMHDGSIRVDSKETMGTTFSISLPLWVE